MPTGADIITFPVIIVNPPFREALQGTVARRPVSLSSRRPSSPPRRPHGRGRPPGGPPVSPSCFHFRVLESWRLWVPRHSETPELPAAEAMSSGVLNAESRRNAEVPWDASPNAAGRADHASQHAVSSRPENQPCQHSVQVASAFRATSAFHPLRHAPTFPRSLPTTGYFSGTGGGSSSGSGGRSSSSFSAGRTGMAFEGFFSARPQPVTTAADKVARRRVNSMFFMMGD